MGISLFVGSKDSDREFSLGSATAVNSFLNEISNHGKFYALTNRSFCEGKLSVKGTEKTLFNTPIRSFLYQCKQAREKNISVDSKEILDILIEACTEAITENTDLFFA